MEKQLVDTNLKKKSNMGDKSTCLTFLLVTFFDIDIFEIYIDRFIRNDMS